MTFGELTSMKFIFNGLSLVASYALLVTFTGCVHTGAPIERGSPSLLFVQSSQSGSIKPLKNKSGVYSLTLTGVSKSTVYFSDRPFRNVGHESTRSFIQDWAVGGARSFEAMPPNAALDIVDSKLGPLVLIVELFNPKFINQGKDLQYEIRILGDSPINFSFTSAKLTADAPGHIPKGALNKFGISALFIDSQEKASQGCNDKDIAVAIHPGNAKFESQMTSCSKSTWGNETKTAACLKKDYPSLSGSCASCYGQTAHCGAQKCGGTCFFHGSDSKKCKNCVYENCEVKQPHGNFSLMQCTGLTEGQLSIRRE